MDNGEEKSEAKKIALITGVISTEFNEVANRMPSNLIQHTEKDEDRAARLKAVRMFKRYFVSLPQLQKSCIL